MATTTDRLGLIQPEGADTLSGSLADDWATNLDAIEASPGIPIYQNLDDLPSPYWGSGRIFSAGGHYLTLGFAGSGDPFNPHPLFGVGPSMFWRKADPRGLVAEVNRQGFGGSGVVLSKSWHGPNFPIDYPGGNFSTKFIGCPIKITVTWPAIVCDESSVSGVIRVNNVPFSHRISTPSGGFSAGGTYSIVLDPIKDWAAMRQEWNSVSWSLYPPAGSSVSLQGSPIRVTRMTVTEV